MRVNLMSVIVRNTRHRAWSRVIAVTVLTAAALLAGSTAHGPGSAIAAAATTGGRPATSAGSPAYNWLTLHQDGTRRGYAANSPLSTSNAAGLGVAWATRLYGAALDSPVVWYDPALGKTLAFIGTEHGDIVAVDVSTGRIVWSRWLGSTIMSTPILSEGSLFVGTFDSPRVYKLNGSTGAVQCSIASPQPIDGTPVAATPPNGRWTVYFGTTDNVTAPGPMLAINARNCSLEWSFSGYASQSGTWDPAAYAVDAAGVPLVLFGSADPDSAVYAVNANTGKEVWRFAAYNPPPGIYDIGAGITVSPPHVNGFAQGVAYVASKYGVMYAINLTSGALIWSYNYNAALHVVGGGISTAALDGTNLVVGIHGGLIDINAVTGTLIWHYQDPANIEVDSSPAIAGPAGSQIVVVGDLAGGVDVVSLATGSQLYHYQTANYITASPAVSDGNILIASADGYLYDFAVGGGNEATLPTTAIKTPAESSTVSYPRGGKLTVQGTASDQVGVAAVMVSVQESGIDGQWWNGATGRWTPGPMASPARLTRTGATVTGWSFTYPIPPSGGTYQVIAYAESTKGPSDVKGAYSSFAVRATTTGPHLVAQSAFVAPGASVTVSGGGFAPSERVVISLLGKTLATATTTIRGGIRNTRVAIPPATAFGQTSLAVRGERSGRTAIAPITVANNWTQVGYNSDHTNYEPNDSTFYNHITPGANIFLDLAWLYQTSSAFTAAPVVADNVAYAGNDTGSLVAIDVQNGAPLWTWHGASGAAIDGAPAVVPGLHLVFIGTGGGKLYAISTITGKTVWTDSIGGQISAPIYGDGYVYVTSSTGTVEAITERTGARKWTVRVANSISAPAALDSVNQVLIVGESDGTVVRLDALTGARKWTYATGAALTAAPAIASGNVYVSSGDSLVAIGEWKGGMLWSYKTGGTVSDTPAIYNGQVFFGSDDGSLYALSAAGSFLWDLPFGHPIVGVAEVHSVIVFVTSSGTVAASRTWTALELWHYQTNAGITAPPVIVNGAAYVAAGDGNLYAFTSYGQPPGSFPHLR